MAWLILLAALIGLANGLAPRSEMALANVTRFAAGDLFSLVGSDCGPTRCMETSHGSALAAMGTDFGCACQCQPETPAYREDQRICVNHIDECPMASFGRGATKPQIPFVFLPLKGQIIYPSKEIVFTDVEDAVCAVTRAQYLSPKGWVTLRDVIDNDVPFGLYRDEGSTFLQWRGSASLHAKLEGRLVAVHVLCSAPTPARLAASCAAFRVAGAAHTALLDVRSIPFHAGETISTEPATQNQGLSVLESLAIGVCVLLLVFVYAAGIIFYIHYKQRQKRKEKDPEMSHNNTMSTDGGSILESRIDLDNVCLKTNPLLKMTGMNGLGGDFLNDAGLSDVSERTEETIDSATTNNSHSHKFQKMNSNVISAMVHTRRKKPSRPSIRSATASPSPDKMTERIQRRSASPDTFERAPHSDLAIVDCSQLNSSGSNHSHTSSDGEPAIRKKLYFNPVFFETEHLKNPPPAAVEFLTKIREVMSIAKEKMSTKKFTPNLSAIPEEEYYHTVDFGWDIPCARRGRRFSAISLKRENSRRAAQCGGCPGCDSSDKEVKSIPIARSNSCKTCVSDNYKQKIVRKWLEQQPSPPTTMTKPVKSVAKVSGTPKSVEPKIPPEPARRYSISGPIIRNEHESSKEQKLIEPIVKHKPKIEEKSTVKEEKLNEDVKVNKQAAKPIEPIITKDKLATQIASLVAQDEKRHATRRVIRKKLPPPPPPPTDPPSPPLPLPPSPTESRKSDEPEPIPPEVKMKMQAVIRELHQCTKGEPKELEEIKTETIELIPPKIVIPVLAADSHYFSDDNMLSMTRKKDKQLHRDSHMEFDSLERSLIKKRRFSLACGPDLILSKEVQQPLSLIKSREKMMSKSWRDVRQVFDENPKPKINTEKKAQPLCNDEVFIESDPVYDNLPKPGPLTIHVTGSPVETRRKIRDDFDPDTLDRKPKRDTKKRVDKILLKSGGSFKHKINSFANDNYCHHLPDPVFNRKIGSLRQIYEAKAKSQKEEIHVPFYERRGSVPYIREELTPFVKSGKIPDLIRQLEGSKDPRPPVPPKQRRTIDVAPKYVISTRESPPGERRRVSEERDRFPAYIKAENLNARRSARRLARTRSRRTDLRKIYRTEDSGYLSTDSNESKRRAAYLMQLRPKSVMQETTPVPPVVITRTSPTITQIESDTDDFESICDGRSESGGESIETDSVFFGNFIDSKQMLVDLGLEGFGTSMKNLQSHDQIDSGFMGETNIILSGDSDSEHKSVISIITDRDGRASSASITRYDEPTYINSMECA